MTIQGTLLRLPRMVVALGLTALLVACAHPIVISPLETPSRVNDAIQPKQVAYVMTDADRNKQVTTEGGGGDKVSYFPYRDLEKVIRDALRAVYADVSVIKSPSDVMTIKENDISLVFAPEITTSSNSQSISTWPPTQFTIELALNVTDAVGNIISRIRVISSGAAEFSEFKVDFGLAGRRAATELSEKLKQEVNANPRLR
ncbi:hypothetical protein [Pollutimonas subterranea]|nr:hypothetical protein [Pollutimonas subterranea]